MTTPSPLCLDGRRCFESRPTGSGRIPSNSSNMFGTELEGMRLDEMSSRSKGEVWCASDRIRGGTGSGLDAGHAVPLRSRVAGEGSPAGTLFALDVRRRRGRRRYRNPGESERGEMAASYLGAYASRLRRGRCRGRRYGLLTAPAVGGVAEADRACRDRSRRMDRVRDEPARFPQVYSMR